MGNPPSRKNISCFVALKENTAGDRCWVAEMMGRSPDGFRDLIDGIQALLNDAALLSREVSLDMDDPLIFKNNVIESVWIPTLELRRLETAEPLLGVEFLPDQERLVISGSREALVMFLDQVEGVAETWSFDAVRFMSEAWGGTLPMGGPNVREDARHPGAIALPFLLVRGNTEFTTNPDGDGNNDSPGQP